MVMASWVSSDRNGSMGILEVPSSTFLSVKQGGVRDPNLSADKCHATVNHDPRVSNAISDRAIVCFG
ncbi:unnamed protein product [Ilex paraguariensis]|uniref:Uncharacterized protein n=1 Tax=Ilex paraguariensis TaxID=185542 RepID=A0ABC8RQ21_9AQUA